MASGRRNWPLRLLVTFVVVAGLLVGADRIAVAVAENIAGDKIQESQGLADRPDVDIAGFPFLTQLAAAHYDAVRITASDVPVGTSDRSLNLHTVTVHLDDVSTSRNFDEVRAAAATADARITFADLAQTLGARVIGADGPDRLKASVQVSVAGQTVTGAISAAVSASDADGITFSDIEVEAGGISVSGAETALGAAFRVPIPLSGLPFDVHISGVEVDAAGVVLRFTGHDLRYAPS